MHGPFNQPDHFKTGGYGHEIVLIIILSDVCTGVPHPSVPVKFQYGVLDSLHSLAHPGFHATRCLFIAWYIYIHVCGLVLTRILHSGWYMLANHTSTSKRSGIHVLTHHPQTFLPETQVQPDPCGPCSPPSIFLRLFISPDMHWQVYRLVRRRCTQGYHHRCHCQIIR